MPCTSPVYFGPATMTLYSGHWDAKGGDTAL